jgi:hypothetical protein
MLYAFGAMVFFIVAWTAAYHIRLSRRKGPSREDFLATFHSANIPETIPVIVHEYYKSSVFGGYAVSPDDSYDEVLKMGDEDIEDDAEYFVKKLGLELPTESVLRGWPSPVRTIRDMVLWLDWVRQQQAKAATQK